MIHSKNWIARIYGFVVFLAIYLVVGVFKVFVRVFDGDNKTFKEANDDSRNHSFTAPMGRIDPLHGEHGDGGINDRYF